MVNIADLKATEFIEHTNVTGENCPAGKLKIKSAEKVEIKKGISAGETKLVLELDQAGKVYSYFPNKTSISALAKWFKSDDTDTWLGKEIELCSENMMVQGKKLKAVFLKV